MLVVLLLRIGEKKVNTISISICYEIACLLSVEVCMPHCYMPQATVRKEGMIYGLSLT